MPDWMLGLLVLLAAAILWNAGQILQALNRISKQLESLGAAWHESRRHK